MLKWQPGASTTYRSVDRQRDRQGGQSSLGHPDHAIPDLHAGLQRPLRLAALFLLLLPSRLGLSVLSVFPRGSLATLLRLAGRLAILDGAAAVRALRAYVRAHLRTGYVGLQVRLLLLLHLMLHRP